MARWYLQGGGTIMSLKRREFTAEFKLSLLREIEAGKPLAQAAREHRINPNLIYRWKERLSRKGADAFLGTAENPEAKIARLERLIGQLTVENAFLKHVLAQREQKRSDSR
jgi:transposase